MAATGAAVEVIRATDTLAVLRASAAAQLGSDVAQFRLPIDLSPIPIVLAWHRQFAANIGHQSFRALSRDALLT